MVHTEAYLGTKSGSAQERGGWEPGYPRQGTHGGLKRREYSKNGALLPFQMEELISLSDNASVGIAWKLI